LIRPIGILIDSEAKVYRWVFTTWLINNYFRLTFVCCRLLSFYLLIYCFLYHSL